MNLDLPNKTQTPRVLIVDDEEDIATVVAEVARIVGFSPEILTDSRRFESIYQAGEFDTIVLDLVMPELDGIEVLRQLAKMGARARIVLMSGFDGATLYTANQLATAHGLTVVNSISKPFRLEEIKTALLGLLQSTVSMQHGSSSTTHSISPDELHQAIEQNEFCYFYQPQVNLQTRKIIGFEALMRWRKQDGSLIPPASFIPLMETLGVIDHVTWQTLGKSLTDFNKLDTLAPGCSLSVNLSPDQLSDLTLPDKLISLVRQFDIPPERLVLEITESGILRELKVALDVLSRIRLKKFGMSIDDFGTGSATLHQLRQLPITELKIDQSFVADFWIDTKDRIIIESTIELAHKLKLGIVAEGIEDKQTTDALLELGVQTGQGYYFGKPKSLDQLLQSDN